MSDNKLRVPTVLIYKQMAENLRTWQIISVIEGIALVTCLIGLILLFPLKTTEIKFVEFSASQDNFFRVLPSNLPKEEHELLLRKFIRLYVFNRTRHDHVTETARFRSVKAYSTPEIFAEFTKQFNKNFESLKTFDRDIVILSDSIIENGKIMIEFKTIDKKGDNMKETNYIATIAYVLCSTLYFRQRIH